MIYQDKQTRRFCGCLIAFCMALIGAGVWGGAVQTERARDQVLQRECSMVTALLQQGVSEEVVANAVANTESDPAGQRYLEKMGRAGDEAVLPASPKNFIKQPLILRAILINLFFSAILLTIVFVFLKRRENLYCQAEEMIRDYASGNFSGHLPWIQEGAVYRMLSSVDGLAAELHAKSEMKQDAKQLMERTITDISRQLKTLIDSLTVYQQTIESKPDNISVVMEFSARMESTLNQMQQMIQDVVKITRLDAGSVVFKKDKHLICELVSQSVNELTARAERENKKIITEGSREEFLYCDTEWMREAVGNLVRNALDYTPEGGTVRISWKSTPKVIRIYIRDNGEGIAADEMCHIFKWFYRGRKAANTQAAGMGLPLAKAIVEGQGGVISVKSGQGKGTNCILSFLAEPSGSECRL